MLSRVHQHCYGHVSIIEVSDFDLALFAIGQQHSLDTGISLFPFLSAIGVGRSESFTVFFNVHHKKKKF